MIQSMNGIWGIQYGVTYFLQNFVPPAEISVSVQVYLCLKSSAVSFNSS